MKQLFDSLYARLLAGFFVLLLTVGVVLGVISVRSAMRYVDETEQKLNRSLAGDLASRFQPYLHDSIDHERIEAEIRNLTGINPRIDIYLLGSNGMIKAAYPRDRQRAVTTVETALLDRFMQDPDLPILGPDPVTSGRQKPFSVAPIQIMGEYGCYLYVVLGGQRYDTAAATIRESYILQMAVAVLVLVLLATAIVGTVLLRLLTRRLRVLRKVVSRFEAGELDARMPSGAADEVGQLAVSFNQMADALVLSMEELKRSDQLRRELIANISHDLRSPLSSIQGYLETTIMKEATLTAEERRTYLDVGIKNTQVLNKLVDELFELSKLDSEQANPQFEPFSIAELVQDVVMQFQPEASRNGINLEAELPDHLSLVYADIAMVERAIANLIENAIRYTPSGGRVRIVPSNEGDAVRLTVIDTGIGIPEKDLPYVLDRFYRVEKSRDRDRGGAGLGLAITKKIVELHGSKIRVQSAIHEGSTFTFTLPAFQTAFSAAATLQTA